MTEAAPPFPDPASHAIFLDFDGTLVDFAEDPEAVTLDTPVRETLDRLHTRFSGALALVSGRAVASLDRLTAPLRLPAAGVHGLEMRVRDTVTTNEEEAARLKPARALLEREMGDGERIRVEDKGGAIVLHYRGAPEAADRARTLAEAAAGEDVGLVATSGHAIAEIRPKAITKAGAIAMLLDHAPFAGRLPVFLGDDVTDEDGFRAAQDAGGYGIKVGEGETAARYRLASIAAVHEWLASGCAETGA
ncbi:trehalose-phosphatase [Pararhizobium mangrovi]|uniref:Trehalose 6-phosphate phosphatase n=1 Tax=Pararhizobium mangrovi TaxID=2590452 RepID=A0A506UCP4_9HYPH|nr:trehalose-phosphatase [Pararhizobium mangrovi]TPW30724.1 trehalose-phosphatase [Pararhizobium mangrovi]